MRSVTAYNRFALVTGAVPNEATKMDIERIVGGIPNVKGIANELVVGNPASRRYVPPAMHASPAM